SHATAFAGCGANPSGELRKIIGVGKYLVCFEPGIAIHGIVEFRNHISERTTMAAKRNSAVHAARGLLIQLHRFKRIDKLFVVFYSFLYRTLLRKLTFIFQKTC